jgi:hypothetical protein
MLVPRQARDERTRRGTSLFLLLLLACTPPQQTTPPEDAGTQEPPPSSCPAGTMLFPGSNVCQPGDWAGCGAGFEPDDSGWGCKPVVPAQPCTQATREALGQTSCVPVGDCAAPVSSDATLFVDITRTVPDDGTHFSTIKAALAAAPSGAKVFIGAGQYAEQLTAARPVTLVGKCPAQTHIVGYGTWPSLRVTSAGVALEGLTLRGGYVGLSLSGGSSLTGKDLVLDGNNAVGISLAEAGSSVTLSNSVIRNTASSGSFPGWGVSIQNGSTATFTDCALVANHVTALRASGTDSSITATRVVVRDTQAGVTNDWGRGAVAQNGANLTLDHVSISSSVEIGVVLAVNSLATLTDVVVRDTQLNSAGAFGRAINVSDSSKLTLVHSTLSRNRDASLMVVGVGALADVRSSVIYSTTRAQNDVARGITVQEEGGLALSGSAVVGSVEGGVVIVDEGTWGSLGRSAVLQTATDAKGGFGHGLVMGLSNVDARDCQFGSNGATGIAVGPGSFIGAELTLTNNGTGVFVDNTVTLNVVDQVPASAGNDQAYISSSSRFIGNTQPSASGNLIVPVGLFH